MLYIKRIVFLLSIQKVMAFVQVFCQTAEKFHTEIPYERTKLCIHIHPALSKVFDRAPS